MDLFSWKAPSSNFLFWWLTLLLSSSSSSRRRSKRSSGVPVLAAATAVLPQQIPLGDFPPQRMGQEGKEHPAHVVLLPLLRRRRRRRRPFATNEILHLLGGIVDALSAMHDLNISHRDVKLENILLDEWPSEDASSFDDDGRDDDVDVETGRRPSLRPTPVLMDFGSAGPLAVPISSRSDVLTVVDAAARHTTVSYRPPELFEGGLRHEEDATLDYGKVDVWSLGCVLFGMMHGSSPFEVEFVRGGEEEEVGWVKIVECTQLKVLGEVPFPPWAKKGNAKEVGRNGGQSHESGPEESDKFDGRDGKYPLKLYRFVRYMTNQDRLARPDIRAVAKKLEELYMDLLKERWVRYDSGRGTRSGSGMTDGEDDDNGTDAAFDSLLRSRDFV
mmetsp:Transcript_12008/g.22532  ORF Transcript_12008/g.22532 Transcript_12008/m.22532 type:complete len:387 (-) Transcript_12008:183-1343(-)